MQKVTGIKSVDFKVTALGHGAVNWNGSANLTIEVDGKYKPVTNHSLPKLRGYSNIKGYWEDGNPKYKSPQDIDLKKTPLYVSQNCIRYHLFKGEFVDLQSPGLAKNMDKLICSLVGLVRGYVIPNTEEKRTSALLLTDFQEQLGNGNFEQMTRAGNKSGEDKSSTIFSKTTFGDTSYIGYGSISIEQLQFISLDERFGRKALVGFDNNKDGEQLAKKITDYINLLKPSTEAKAEYHQNYVRRGSIYKIGEAGILLNDAAIDILVQEALDLIKQLSIKQAKGYMFVDEVLVDYNDGSTGRDMMRIKHTPSNISEIKKDGKNYAVYFEGVAK